VRRGVFEAEVKRELEDPFFEWYIPVRGAARLFFALMGGRSVYGAENLPKTGAAIVASNHVSMTDPPLVPSCIERPIYVMAKEELFKIPVVSTVLRKVRSFPVKRGTADRAALRHAINLLEKGHLVLIFPEGERGPGGDLLLPAQRGLSMIATKANVPIIPAYAKNTDKMLPRNAKFPKRIHTSVTFGKPIDPAHFKGDKSSSDPLGEAVMAAIDDLRKKAQ
jgi:1-acyl-sn-glycerol-3-phosphate acyltransferase